MFGMSGLMGEKRMVVVLAAVGTVCFGLGATRASWGEVRGTRFVAPRKMGQSRVERVARVKKLGIDE